MENLKTNSGTSLLKGAACYPINWNDPLMPLPSAENCLRCIVNLYTMISDNSAEYAALSIEQRIVFLKEIVCHLNLVESLFNQNHKDFLEMKLEFETAMREQSVKVKKEMVSSSSVAELLALLGLEKIRVNGTISEIGKKVGEFFFHCVDANKNHMFDLEAIAIAKLICVLFVSAEGKEFNLHTMEGNVGKARKGDQNEGK